VLPHVDLEGGHDDGHVVEITPEPEPEPEREPELVAA